MTVSYDDAVPGDQVDVDSQVGLGCGVQGPKSYWCSRVRGHGGQHVGNGHLGNVYDVWPQEAASTDDKVTLGLRANLARDLKDATWIHVAAVVRPGASHKDMLADVDRTIVGVLVDAIRVLADRPLDPEGLSALADFIESE